MAAHILGYSGHPACPHSSEQANTDAKDVQEKARIKKASADPAPTSGKRSHDAGNDAGVNTAASEPARPAKKQRDGSFCIISAKESEYDIGEEAAVRRQACRAIISSGSAFALFEDEEMKKLFDMVRVGTSDILPSGKAASGSLLNKRVSEVDIDIRQVFREREVGIVCVDHSSLTCVSHFFDRADGWKAQKKNSVNGVCGNVDFKSYPLELIDATALTKDGPAQCRQFADIIDAIEKKHKCKVIYFITDADGGSLKGRKLLPVERPYLFLISCMAHQTSSALL